MKASCAVCGTLFKKNYATRRCCSRKCAAALLGTKEQRFWQKVEKTEACWFWRAGLVGPMQYGRFKYAGVSDVAHRVSWELHTEQAVPDGMQVLHSCDVPSCVRPDHLFLGTQLDNMHDMRAKGRAVQVRGEKHGRAKLTETQVLELLAEAKGGKLTTMQLAIKYGLHPVYVSKVVRGDSWTHLPR